MVTDAAKIRYFIPVLPKTQRRFDVLLLFIQIFNETMNHGQFSEKTRGTVRHPVRDASLGRNDFKSKYVIIMKQSKIKNQKSKML